MSNKNITNVGTGGVSDRLCRCEESVRFCRRNSSRRKSPIFSSVRMIKNRSLFDHVRWITPILLLICFTTCVTCEKEPVDFGDPVVLPKNVTSDDSKISEPRMEKIEPPADIGFIHAFIAAISVIIVSELGDKTFFIAAIMAMKHARLTVFAGAMLALAVMTVLSASVGGFAMAIIPRAYTYYVSTALFAIFGLKMLKEGYSMQPHEAQEEYEEVQAELKKREDEVDKQQKEGLVPDAEAGVTGRGTVRRSRIFSLVSRVFLQSFTLTFLAEWGDRSQLTTIILAAREDAIGVTLGGIIGHAFCTSLAVIGGRMIAQKISVRTVTLIGGVVFLIFAVSALFIDPNS